VSSVIYCQDNWTALLNAAKQGFADVLLLLLEVGANIEHRDTVSFNSLATFALSSLVGLAVG